MGWSGGVQLLRCTRGRSNEQFMPMLVFFAILICVLSKNGVAYNCLQFVYLSVSPALWNKKDRVRQ